jgi:hypothetical protein
MVAHLCVHYKVVQQSPLAVRSQLLHHATASLFGIPPRTKDLSTGLVHAVQAVNKTI